MNYAEYSRICASMSLGELSEMQSEAEFGAKIWLESFTSLGSSQGQVGVLGVIEYRYMFSVCCPYAMLLKSGDVIRMNGYKWLIDSHSTAATTFNKGPRITIALIRGEAPAGVIGKDIMPDWIVDISNPSSIQLWISKCIVGIDALQGRVYTGSASNQREPNRTVNPNLSQSRPLLTMPPATKENIYEQLRAQGIVGEQKKLSGPRGRSRYTGYGTDNYLEYSDLKDDDEKNEKPEPEKPKRRKFDFD